MNPTIAIDYPETAAWLEGFVRSHAKRQDSRLEAIVEADGPREGRSYGVRLALGTRTEPPLGSPPIELEYREVAEGRTRFAWCATLGERIRTVAGTLLGTRQAAG